MSDRGVSDVIGYILVFSLVIATVGIVSVVGFAGLDERQEAEQMDNMERAFDVFDYNMEDVYLRGAPSRATEMRLGGGTLRYGNRVNITVESGSSNVTARPRPLIYADHDTEIVYTAGAIIRTDGDASVMLQRPPFRLDTGDTDRLVVPLIETSRPPDQTSAAGERTLRVTSTARSINGTVPTGLREPTANVTVTVESPRADAWERHFERNTDGNVTRTGDEVTVEIDDSDVSRVSATRFRIRLRFVR